MTVAQAIALISLSALGALFIVLGICALGRCSHELHWQIDANKIIQRCYCGERSQPMTSPHAEGQPMPDPNPEWLARYEAKLADLAAARAERAGSRDEQLAAAFDAFQTRQPDDGEGQP